MAPRAWSLISAPVLDADGRTQLILQRVEDDAAASAWGPVLLANGLVQGRHCA